VFRRVIGVAIVFALLSAAPAFAVDWTQAGRTSARIGFNGAEDVLNAGNVTTLQPQWTYAAAGVVGSPVVAGNKVFFSSEAGELIAVDEASGLELWRRSVATSGAPRLAVDKKRGIVVASWDGNLQAFRTATGEPAWDVPGAGTSAANPTDPAIVQGKVFSTTAGGSVIAVNVADGGVLWECVVPAPCAAASTSPAVAGGRVLFVSDDGVDPRLQALAVDSGAPLWDRTAPSGVEAGPLVAAGVVYTASITEDDVVARSVLDGTLVFSKNVPGTTALSFAQGVLYAGRSVAGTAISGGIVAIDAMTGDRLWKLSTGGFSVTTAPTIANGLIYAGVSDLRATPAGDGRMLVVSTTLGIDGTPEVQVKHSPGMDQYWRSAPAVVNGHVVVGHGNGMFALAP
jgi:outer membrane protein assembly factor BamB